MVQGLLTFCQQGAYVFEGKPVTLKYVKFQNVRSLTIFIEDNQSGSDITKVQKMALYGTIFPTYSAIKNFKILGRNHGHEGIEEDRGAVSSP